jgi:hypothetical protein
MRSVPFTISDVHGGFSEGRGTICVEGDDVVIEVQVSLFSLFNQEPKTFRFDMTDLEEIEHRRGVWGDRLTIRTRPMDRVAQIPGAGEGKLVVKTKRSRRADLDRLLDHLEMWVT